MTVKQASEASHNKIKNHDNTFLVAMFCTYIDYMDQIWKKIPIAKLIYYLLCNL